MVELNFLQSSEYSVFVKEASENSKNKLWTFIGKVVDGTNIIYTYLQQIWLHGGYLVESLKDINFI